MSAMPTLPFVVLQTHKPSSTAEIIATAAALAAAPAAAPATASAATTGLSSSSVSSLKPPRSPTSPAPASRAAPGSGGPGLLPSSPGGTRPSSSINHTHSLPGSSSTRARADNVAAAMPSTIPPSSSGPGPSVGGATSSPVGSNNSGGGGGGGNNSSNAASTIQVRTLHPQVHYIFENDPLENEILESVPKSRSITLDFDPRTGTIRNVESFLTHLQVMDVKFVPFQATLPSLSTSSSSTSLNSMVSGIHSQHHTAGGESQQQQQQQQQQHRNTTAPTLGRTNSSGASSINSSMTKSATKMTRRPSERSLGNPAGTGGEVEDKAQAGIAGGGGAGKDWTLVINAVEVDGKDLDSESEMLEQSMLSSFDTDMGSEDPLAYSDALLKSFQTRNMLVRKVIDYTTSTSSAGAATTPQ
ncbi:unnamed protein product [Mortierella alpina]